MNELSEGVRIDRLKLASGHEYVVGEENIKAITVCMQAGQGGMVPWVQVESNDGIEGLMNCAHIEGVTLAKKDAPHGS